MLTWKVLIVDDWEDISVLLRRRIESTQFTVIVEQVLDVPEAVPAIQKFKPHVVILDNRLPSGSGLGLIQQVKKQLPGTPVIMFTGYTDTHTEKIAKDLGADYFFYKNDDFEKLVETLARLTPQPV